MKHLLPLLCLLFAWQVDAKVYYVKSDATGSNNGSSWSNAYKDLQRAIDAVPAGSELWIAGGNYRPTSRTKPITIKKGLYLYGGFKGSETKIEDRNWTTNYSRVSADINGDDIESYTEKRSDNAYHALVIESSGTVYLDGIYVTNGAAKYTGDYNDLNSIGGGLLLKGKLVMNHCYFLYNTANYGAGLVLLSGSVEMDDCLFQLNYAKTTAGAMYAPNSSTKLTATKSTFKQNSSGDTGGAYSANLLNTNDFKNCLFTENSAPRGGAVEVTFGAKVTCSDTEYSRNSSTLIGGALFVNGKNSSFKATSCTFSENLQCCDQNGLGGGVAAVAYDAFLDFDKCDFTGNKADVNGGCFLIVDASVTASRSDLTDNEASGGGVTCLIRENKQPVLQMTDCDHLRNKAAYYGGAILNSSGAIHLDGGFLSDNYAGEFGGAIASYDIGNVAELDNLRFQKNIAVDYGGAVDVDDDSQTTINDCSFEKNSAGYGGALSTINDDRKSNNWVTIRRSHFIQNSATKGGAAVTVWNHNLWMENCLVDQHDIRQSTYDGIIYVNDYDNYQDQTYLINNTFTQNTTDKGFLIEYQDGDNTNLILQNNIFANSGPELGIEAGKLEVVSKGGNLCASNGMKDYLNHGKDQNNKNPKLAADYSLLAGSPAIDAGISDGAPSDDYHGHSREGAIDAGAFEAIGLSALATVQPWEGKLRVMGNPVRSVGRLRIETQESQQVQIELLNTAGQMLQRWVQTKLPGTYDVELPLPNVATGTHYFRVWIEGRSRAVSVVLVSN